MITGVRRADKGWQSIRELAKKLAVAQPYVKAGVLGKGRKRSDGRTNAEIAIFNEFGTIKNPPRPFVAPSFRRWRETYVTQFVRLTGGPSAWASKAKILQALSLIGLRMAADMKNFITMGSPVPPPNSPFTVKAKGSSRTLVDSGAMVNSITSQVVGQ